MRETRDVIIEVRFRIRHTVLKDMDTDAINFHLNDSSYCADNLVEDLIADYQRCRADDGCFCDRTYARVITAASDGWAAANLP